MHPALPWFFTDLFTAHTGNPDSPAAAAAERVYAHAYATLGRYYFRQAEEGRAGQVLPVLRIEEPNLTHGRGPPNPR